MSRLEIYLFGLPHIELDGNLVNIKTHKAMGLIAYLSMLKKRQSRESLTSFFWPQSDQRVASGSLRTTLWRMKKSGLSDWFWIDRESVGIKFIDNLYIDALYFNELIEKSTNHGHSSRISCNECISILEDIVDLFQTGFMHGYFIYDSNAFEEWQLFTQERIRYVFSAAIGRLVNAYRSKENFYNALTYSHHWLTIDPYHDEANRLLMQLYIDAGQRESALNHYDDYVRILKRDLNISPDEGITRIYHQIKSGIRSPTYLKKGALTGFLFHVNFLSVASSQGTDNTINLEEFRNYTNYLINTINSYGGKILSVKLDSITALFIDGDPLNCALIIQKELNREPGYFSNENLSKIVIISVEKDSFLNLINEFEYEKIMHICQSAWDGQIFISSQVLANFDLPKGGQVIDLGIHELNESGESIHIFGLTHPQLINVDNRSPSIVSGHPHILPPQTTSFIGREFEISLISSLLESLHHPLISLIGPGGIGKTRLAIQVAANQKERFMDGIYFVPLDSKTKSEQFFSKLSDVFNFRLSGNGNPQDQIYEYLVEKQTLLIIDNFENLVQGPLVLSELIRRLPALKIMITSRERSNLMMEWVEEIQGLSYPITDKDEEVDAEIFSACKLFIQCARKVLPEFDPDDEQKKCIGQMCRIVNGSPLAIELAAAWVRSLKCCEITDHIRANLDFLSGSMQELPARHHSLRAVFEHSWSLLSDLEQQLLCRLSIFRGSFHMIAAEQIVNANIQTLTSCVDKSILRYNLDGRYEIPETIRFFAEERLNSIPFEKSMVIKEFCRYYSIFSKECEADMLGHEQLRILEKVQVEMMNIVHGWNLALQTRNYDALDQFINTMFLYHEIKCLYHDGSEYFRNALDAVNQVSDSNLDILKIKLQVRLGWYLFISGFYEEGLKYLEEKLPIAQDNHLLNETLFMLNQLGNAYRMIGDFDRAFAYIFESIALCEDEDLNLNPFLNFSYAQALLQLGALYISQNQLDQARDILLRCTEMFERTGNLWWVAKAYGSLGFVTERMEEFSEAKKLREKSLVISKKIGDKRSTALALNNLAGTLEKLGEKTVLLDYFPNLCRSADLSVTVVLLLL
jgi:DNA-binding SARP family transcriptional activator/predicted ATPase